MDGRASGDRSIDPEELLRSALEKIVFFECRVEQLESELSAARAAVERARAESASSRRGATEVERALAGERGQRGEAESRAQELAERVRLLEGERERMLGGLVDRARLGGAPGADGDAPEEGGADLAGFIAELRGEIERLRAWKAAAVAAGVASPGAPAPTPAPLRPAQAAEPVVRIAERLRGEGRLGVAPADAGRLAAQLPTDSDRVLYVRSVDQLASTEPARRLRAVRALEALGSRAAAPVLAGALGREADGEVKAAILGALARFREPFAAELARGALDDPRGAVRVAALEALAAVAEGSAEDRIAAALRDPSPLVRRRAAILLGFSRSMRADEALAGALADADAGVARAAAAALSGRPSGPAQGALARALDHRDPSVRRAAAGALGRWTGEAVDGDAPAHERRRAGRRIAERLAAMDGVELRRAVLAAAPAEKVSATQPATATATRTATAASTRTTTANSTPTATATPTATPTPTASANSTPTATAVATAPATRTAVAVLDPDPDPDLDAAVLGEVRTALRGRSADEIAAALAVPRLRADAALHALAARGAVVARGPRWFTS